MIQSTLKREPLKSADQVDIFQALSDVQRSLAKVAKYGPDRKDLIGVDVASEALNALYNAMYKSYLEAGAIYGETGQGFGQWFDEVKAIANMRWAADRTEREHEECAAHQHFLKGAAKKPKRLNQSTLKRKEGAK
jgi:hypothetical protein